MKAILLAGICVLGLMSAAAKADVILDPHLSGTGDNVIFDTLNGHTAIGTFNGMHTGVVDFTDLSGDPLFTAASNGNDIKVADTSDLQVVVYSDLTNTTVLDTSTQVFSLKGTGDVTAIVQATNGSFTFDLGQISPNAQSGFTLTAINGEVMSKLTLIDNGGIITDYEHYRIDVAAPLAVPGAALGTGLPGLISGVLGMFWFARRRRNRE